MPDALSRVELRVADEKHTGWTSLSVVRSIEQIAGTFALEMTEHWPNQGAQRPIKPGAACELLLGNETVITGFVDDVRIQYTTRAHRITVAGRDKTGDLVDCAAVHKSGQWAGKKIEQIARDLLAPFGLKVIVATDTGKAFPTFNAQPSETVFECLERAARMRGLLLMSDVHGNLVIARAGSARIGTALVEGENIEQASGEWSWKERFSTYTVQSQGRMNDSISVDAGVHAKAVVKDPVINRYRPLIVLSEDQGSSATLTDRANWEQSVRAGRGNRGSITVTGWRHADGIYLPNTLVTVRSPMLALDAQMLIVRCGYSISREGGSTTELTIARPEAFELIEGAAQQRLSRRLDGQRWRKKKDKPAVDWGDL